MNTKKQIRSVICTQIQDFEFSQVEYIDFLINEAQNNIATWSWCNLRIFSHELTAGQSTYNMFNCPTTNADAVIIVEDVLVYSTDRYKPLNKYDMWEINRMYADWWTTKTGVPTSCAVEKDFLVIVPAVSVSITDGIIIITRSKPDDLVNDDDVCKLHSQFQGYIVDYVIMKVKNDIAGLVKLEQLMNNKKQELKLRLDRFLQVKQQMLTD